MADINIKAKMSVDTGNSTEQIKKVQDGLNNTKENTKDSVKSFEKLKGEIGNLSPALGKAAGGAGTLNQAFNLLKANPIIAVIGILVGIVVALFQKFKQMEAVSDALGKAFGTLSGIFEAFMSKILTPLIGGFVKLVEFLTSGVITVLDALGVTSKATAERFGEITEALDDLEDAQKNSAIAQAESNRKLQEAREIAADANRPIKERVTALREAARIEKEESDKVIELNRTKAKLMMEQIALEMGARADLVNSIRNGTIENLKAARAELASQANVNKEKLYAIDQYIIAAENEAASRSKIAKKTESQITGIEKEEQAKRLQQRKEHEEKLKKLEEDRLKADHERIESAKNTFDNYIKGLQGNIEEQKEKEKKILDEKAKDQSNFDKVRANALASQTATTKQSEEELKKLNEDNLLREKTKQDALKASGEALVAVGNIIGQQTVAGKALGIAQATMNTFLGITEIWRNKTTLPEPFGTIGKIAATVTAAASGFAAVRGIIRTPVPGGGGGGGGSVPTMAAPVLPQQVSTTLSGQTIQNIGNVAAGGVARSYVLQEDINNSKEREARLQRAARLN